MLAPCSRGPLPCPVTFLAREAAGFQVLGTNPVSCGEAPSRTQVLDFCRLEHIGPFNHPCSAPVRGRAMLSWGSEDTRDPEKDALLGAGPAGGTGCGVGRGSACAQGRAAFAGAGEAPSGRLRKHEAVVKLPGAQPRGETFGWRPACDTRRGEGEFFFPIKSSDMRQLRRSGVVSPFPGAQAGLGWTQPLINHSKTSARGQAGGCQQPALPKTGSHVVEVKLSFATRGAMC